MENCCKNCKFFLNEIKSVKLNEELADQYHEYSINTNCGNDKVYESINCDSETGPSFIISKPEMFGCRFFQEV